MQPLRTLESTTAPDGSELTLLRRGDDFLLQIDRHDLMTSRMHGSEDELARLALETVRGRKDARVLVGGLGMGFTLRAALDALGRSARVTVAEVVPEVVDWNRRHLGHLAGRPLDDPRVRVAVGDVGAVAAQAPAAFDAILLDVDNGPGAPSLHANLELYGPAGLARLHRALTPRGILAVWSVEEDPRFVDRLGRAGFHAARHRVSARAGGKGGRHVIFIGRRLERGTGRKIDRKKRATR